MELLIVLASLIFLGAFIYWEFVVKSPSNEIKKNMEVISSLQPKTPSVPPQMVVDMAYAFESDDDTRAAELWNQYPGHSAKDLFAPMSKARERGEPWFGRSIDWHLMAQWEDFLFRSLELLKKDYIFQMEERLNRGLAKRVFDSEVVVKMAHAFEADDVNRAADLWDAHPTYTVNDLKDAMIRAIRNGEPWMGKKIDSVREFKWHRFLRTSIAYSRKRDYIFQMEDRLKLQDQQNDSKRSS